MERRGEHEDGNPVPVSTARTLRIPRSSRSSGYGHRKKNGNKRTSCLNLNRLVLLHFLRGAEGKGTRVRCGRQVPGAEKRPGPWGGGQTDGGEA